MPPANAKRRRSRKQNMRPSRPPRSNSPKPPKPTVTDLLRQLTNAILHRNLSPEPIWRALPWILLFALAARLGIALSGDVYLHPDEIMQYLEPAHKLVFGNGGVFWEFFHGARSWLIPGLIAGLLMLCKLLGLGEPGWYIAIVKGFFCLFSLIIPAAMYFFARQHFNELTARIALLGGAFWYELVGFAHKPMTEFVATSLIMLLLMVVSRNINRRILWAIAGLAVLAAAVRFQYAPIAAILLLIGLLRCENIQRKLELIIAAAIFLFAVGIFDGLTWDGILFHSYITNLQFNWNYPFAQTTSIFPFYQFFWWLTLASFGLAIICLIGGFYSRINLHRYALLLILISVLLILHTFQTHKEYRFIFAAIPLWLLIGSDLLARFFIRISVKKPALNQKLKWAIVGGAVGIFNLISAVGIMNQLPLQAQVYYTPFAKVDSVGVFMPAIYDAINPNRNHIFHTYSAYRWLARNPNVAAVWQAGKDFASIPGYYYLHNKIPLYTHNISRQYFNNEQDVQRLVTHIVTEFPNHAVSGFSTVKKFGQTRILQRDPQFPPPRKWQNYTPHFVNGTATNILRRFGLANPRPVPPNFGIQFVDAPK